MGVRVAMRILKYLGLSLFPLCETIVFEWHIEERVGRTMDVACIVVTKIVRETATDSGPPCCREI